MYVVEGEKDVETLLSLLRRLVVQRNTVVIVEHRLELISRADWIIDMGPDSSAVFPEEKPRPEPEAQPDDPQPKKDAETSAPAQPREVVYTWPVKGQVLRGFTVEALAYDETMGDWLEEISGDFPDVFFEELDGGIQLAEEALPDPEFPPGEMYIMGEYCHDLLGRYIVLYYGSFAALLAEEDEEVWKDELFVTVAHEFTHHMEETAGLHALDDKDAEFLRQAREEYGDLL